MCVNKGHVLCLFFIVLVVVIKGSVIKKIAVDIGKNITITCPIQQHVAADVMWLKRGRDQQHFGTVLSNGSLFLMEADRNDSGLYSCNRQNVVNSDEGMVNVTVRTPPPPLNIRVKSSTIISLLIWEVEGTGGYPIIDFTAEYRVANVNNTWIPISPNHITPNARQLEIYSLNPNTTYEYRMWATNALGRGEIVNVFDTTKGQYPESELAKHFFEGADKFDTRVWAVAVGVVLGTLVLFGMGTCALLYYECRMPITVHDEQEIIELVPNIILNPGFEGSSHQSDQPDENYNSETVLRLNNNTVVQPTRLIV